MHDFRHSTGHARRLVTHDNDGQPIPAAVLNCILREAEARFGGYTLGNPESGSWIEGGVRYAETSCRLEVVIAAGRSPRVRDLVGPGVASTGHVFRDSRRW